MRKLGLPAAALLLIGVVLYLLISSLIYTTETYLLLDVDTLKPVAGANVTLEPTYWFWPDDLKFLLPGGDSARTDDDGRVTLRVPRKCGTFLMGISAAGYTFPSKRFPDTFEQPRDVDDVFFLMRSTADPPPN